MNLVKSVTFTCAADATAPAYFVVSIMVLGHKRENLKTEYYNHLSWTEAADVIYASFDEYRPGIIRMGDNTQPTLW